MEDRNETTKISTSAQLQKTGLVLHITDHCWQKLMGFCRATDLEVSGFMLLDRDGENLTVSDCFIPDQFCTGSETEMEGNSILKLQMELFKRKLIGQPNKTTKLAHFHTHPTFNVFWSGTDMIMRETLRQGADYYVSLVINQKGEALAAIDINGEFPMSISNLPIDILPNEDDAIIKFCQAEVKAKVKQRTYTPLYQGAQVDAFESERSRRKAEKRAKGRVHKEMDKDVPWWVREGVDAPILFCPHGTNLEYECDVCEAALLTGRCIHGKLPHEKCPFVQCMEKEEAKAEPGTGEYINVAGLVMKKIGGN